MKILHANTAGSLPAKVETLEAATTRWLARWSVTILRVTVNKHGLSGALYSLHYGKRAAI